MEYRYTAIVLKKREVGETDRIYTFFTREAGKVSSIAKGVRKSEAKLAAALETGSQADIIVVRTRGMGKIAGATLEHSFPATRSHFEALRLTLESLAVVDRLVEPDERDEELYTLLMQYLELTETLVLTGRTEQLSLIAEAFFFQLAAALGYPLQLGSCAVSGERLVPGERYVVSPSAGGVVSAAHAASVQDGLAVGTDSIKLLRLFAEHSLANLVKVVAPEASLQELARFRKIFLAWIRR